MLTLQSHSFNLVKAWKKELCTLTLQLKRIQQKLVAFEDEINLINQKLAITGLLLYDIKLSLRRACFKEFGHNFNLKLSCFSLKLMKISMTFVQLPSQLLHLTSLEL